MAAKKLSISLHPDIAASVAASAGRHGESVSSWLDRAARHALRIEDGLAAVEEYEQENGRFTDAEIAEADRILEEHFGPDLGRRR